MSRDSDCDADWDCVRHCCRECLSIKSMLGHKYRVLIRDKSMDRRGARNMTNAEEYKEYRKDDHLSLTAEQKEARRQGGGRHGERLSESGLWSQIGSTWRVWKEFGCGFGVTSQ